jgi:hypothetical protein
MFEYKPDFETSLMRMEAFWEGELVDRPVVQFQLEKPYHQRAPLPVSRHPTSAERWLDPQYQAEYALTSLGNQVFLGDTLPVAFPNLGPELFSALYGCPLHFGDYGTSWTDPILHDWSQAEQLRLDWDHPLLKALVAITDAMIEAGNGKFITGMTDWHPGGDAIAAFRDPQNLAVDLISNLSDVLTLLDRVTIDYYRLYDIFYEKLRAAGLPISTWTPLASTRKYYVPSNDFSIMISNKMYVEIFLPGIIQECQFLDRSIYHLDGPGALRHLDTLLSIPELNAVQFVPGAGNEVFSRWVNVYQRIQAAGKGAQVNCRVDELDEVMHTLDPRHLYLNLTGVANQEQGLAILNQLEQWTAERYRVY